MARRGAKHVAIIMDGNGRWAQQRGKERVEGHVAGVERVRSSIKAAIREGVQYLTLYAFSTENWGRPADEVEALMELMAKSIIAELPELTSNGVQLKYIGDRSRFSQSLQELMAGSEMQSVEEQKLIVMVALNYSSRDEIRRAIVRLIERGVSSELITEQMISEVLDTAGIPDPDLIIRTSGEERLSNFLLWQASYSEFYFTECLWPDFDEQEFSKALRVYEGRARRFGLIEEQI